MSFWSLLRHRIQSYWRVPFVGPRLAAFLAGTVFVLYVGGVLGVAGTLFDDIVRGLVPGGDPLLVASRGLLPVGIGYLALRIGLESGLGVDPRPYQVLPCRRRSLAGLLAVSALFSVWNVLPLVFLGAVCVEAALGGAGGEALRFGLSGLGGLGAISVLAPMGRHLASDRMVVSGGMVLLLGGTLGVGAVHGGVAWTSLLDSSAWLFGGIVQAERLPLVAGGSLFVGIAAVHVRWRRAVLDVDRPRPSSSPTETSSLLRRLARRGAAMREAVLALKLLLRNSRPRFMAVASLFPPAVIALLGSLGAGRWGMLRELAGVHTLMLGLWGTGTIVLAHGMNLFSWEGGSIDGMLARPENARSRVRGKLLLLAASAGICVLIPVPFALLGGSHALLLLQAVFLLYNVGVLAPVVTAGALFNRTAVDPNGRALGQVNYSGGRTAVVLPFLLLPSLPFLLFDRLLFSLVAVGGGGGLSILAAPLWVGGLATLYERNRYAIARGFRASRH